MGPFTSSNTKTQHFTADMNEILNAADEDDDHSFTWRTHPLAARAAGTAGAGKGKEPAGVLR